MIHELVAVWCGFGLVLVLIRRRQRRQQQIWLFFGLLKQAPLLGVNSPHQMAAGESVNGQFGEHAGALNTKTSSDLNSLCAQLPTLCLHKQHTYHTRNT